MTEIVLQPVAGSGYEAIVQATAWNPNITEGLGVIKGIGWLGHQAVKGGPIDLVGFSVEQVDEPLLRPPYDMQELADRVPDYNLGRFYDDRASRGLGSMIAIHPWALQPPSMGEKVAVRAIRFNPDRFYARPQLNLNLQVRGKNIGDVLRMGRHGSLLVASAMVDNAMQKTDKWTDYRFNWLTDHRLQGTAWAADFMARNYPDSANLIELEVPPIWKIQQQAADIKPDKDWRVLLARGGQYAAENVMKTVGEYRVLQAA